MADKTPLKIESGQVEQFQTGDMVDPSFLPQLGFYNQVIDQVQLTGTGPGYIRPAVVVGVSVAPNNPIDGQTLSLTDGTTTETYTFLNTPLGPFDVQIEASVDLTNEAFAAVLNAQSAIWGGKAGPESDYCIIYEKVATGNPYRVYGSAGTYALTTNNVYTITLLSPLPVSDPVTSNFGYGGSVLEGAIVSVFRTNQVFRYNIDPQAYTPNEWIPLPFQKTVMQLFMRFIKGNSLETGTWYWITDAINNSYTPNGILVQATSSNTISKYGIGGFADPSWDKASSYANEGVIADFSHICTETGQGTFLGNWDASLAPALWDMVYYTNATEYYINITGVNTATPPPSDSTNWQAVYNYSSFDIWYAGFEGNHQNNIITMFPNAYHGWDMYAVKDWTAFDGTDPSINTTAYVRLATRIDNGYLFHWDPIQFKFPNGSSFFITCREDMYGQHIEDFINTTSLIPLWIFNSQSFSNNKVYGGFTSVALNDITGANRSSSLLVQGNTFGQGASCTWWGAANKLIGLTVAPLASVSIGSNTNSLVAVQNGSIASGTDLVIGASVPASSTIEKFTLGSDLGTVELLDAHTEFTITQQGSTVSKVMSGSGNYAAGVLTIPTGYDYIGTFELSDAAGGSISNMAGSIPQRFPFKMTCSNGVSNVYAPSPVAGAMSGDIVSDAGTFTVVGRTNGGDFVEFEQAGTFIRKNLTAIMA